MERNQAFLIIILGLAVLLTITPAAAQGDPTATPTPTVVPTATSPFADLRPTPTYLYITPIPLPTLNNPASNLADFAVQSWRVLNVGRTPTAAGLMDYIVFVGMLGFIFRSAVKLIRERNIESRASAGDAKAKGQMRSVRRRRRR